MMSLLKINLIIFAALFFRPDFVTCGSHNDNKAGLKIAILDDDVKELHVADGGNYAQAAGMQNATESTWNSDDSGNDIKHRTKISKNIETNFIHPALLPITFQKNIERARVDSNGGKNIVNIHNATNVVTTSSRAGGTVVINNSSDHHGNVVNPDKGSTEVTQIEENSSAESNVLLKYPKISATIAVCLIYVVIKIWKIIKRKLNSRPRPMRLIVADEEEML